MVVKGGAAEPQRAGPWRVSNRGRPSGRASSTRASQGGWALARRGSLSLSSFLLQREPTPPLRDMPNRRERFRSNFFRGRCDERRTREWRYGVAITTAFVTDAWRPRQHSG